jgi:predicted phosphodiesterase
MNSGCTNVYAITSIITVSFLLFLVMINFTNNIDLIYAQESTNIPDFNFGSAGDWGCNSNTDATVNSIQNQNPELVLGLGDYSYQSTANCWLNAVNPIDEQMKITIGNHENSVSGEDLNTYLNHFGMTSQYYSFNYENVHFLSMATELSYSSGSAQNLFVEEDLASAAADPNIDWIVVFFHKPMYSSPNSCSASSCQGVSSLRDTYHPLFDQYGVDLVLEGHTHNYQRTFPIKYNLNNPSNPIITNNNLQHYNDPEGQIYAIVGTGGVNFHSLSGKSYFTADQQSIRFGHLNIDIVNDGSTSILDGNFIPNSAGITPDHFTITKSISSPPPPEEICGDGIDNNGNGEIDENCPPSTRYNYEPFLTIEDSNDIVTIPNSQELKIANSFTVAAWFKTSNTFVENGFIVNKGGLGKGNDKNQMNYGIWMTASENIQGGFETSKGSGKFITSSNTYDDNQWHHVVVTYDGSILRMYIDGSEVGSKSIKQGQGPDSSSDNNLVIGANSAIPTDNFFIGNIDEVGVWNQAIAPQDIPTLMNVPPSQFPSTGLVYSNSFGPSVTSNGITPTMMRSTFKDLFS